MEREYIQPFFEDALSKLNVLDKVEIAFETPNNPEHGSLSCNIAMRLTKILKKNPRQIAEEIVNTIYYNRKYVNNIEIAGPGFINIRFSNMFYTDSLKQILLLGENYGKSKAGAGKKVNVEYVSANPTGLLHLGHGRNAAVGDTIANLYKWMGYNVTREYYFNNAGNQMQMLAKSIYARYMQLLGDEAFEFPENGYHGQYVYDIATELIKNYGDKLNSGTYQDLTLIKKHGENWCFDKIRNTLKTMNIKQDIFFNEDILYKDGKIQEIIDELKAKDLAYEKDGALWLSFTKLGLDDDRVIVKSSGEPTYRLPDIAYHREKFRRGYDIIIDIFGSDHVATVPDVLAGVKALGYDPGKVIVVVHQFVTLTENGEQVKMSKRSGKVYTLDELLEEVGADVVRFFLLMRNVNTHLEFDLALAREQSEKNPVFYLQYANARINSIFEKAKNEDIKFSDSVDLSLLNHPAEINLIKNLLMFPEKIKVACTKAEPPILTEYLRETAQAFHSFYHECRIIGEEEPLMQARFKLAKATKTVIRNGLTILGVSAPDKM